MRNGLLFLSSFVAISAATNPAYSQTIDKPEWRVKDRFRLFDRADFDAKREVQTLLDQLANGGKPTTLYQPILDTLSGKRDGRSNSASLRTSNYHPAGTGAPRTSGRYDGAYLFPEKYTIEIRGSANPDLAGATCRYVSAISSSAGPCDKWVSLDFISGQAMSQMGWHATGHVQVTIAGQVRGPLPIDITDRLVVALGDSYISGEGNPDRPSIITDNPDAIFEKAGWGGEAQLGVQVMSAAKWWDEPCHRSLLSWPVLATLAQAGRNPHEAISLVHLGCSGAVARDIYRHGEGDLPGGGDETESQLELLANVMKGPSMDWGARKVDSVLLSVGGNDIGFAGVLSTLLLPPNGFTLGPLIARAVGDGAGAVCPYRESGKPISRLCEKKISAEERLVVLPGELDALQMAMERLGITERVLQTQYPNPLIGVDGQACDNNPSNDDRRQPIHPSHNAVVDEAFDGGFEALMGVVPKNRRGGRYSWGYEIMYLPEKPNKKDVTSSPLYRDDPIIKIECDDLPETNDSEVCQAIWTHYKLNSSLQKASRGWINVNTHVANTMRHGVCVGDDLYRMAMPKVERLSTTGKARPWRWVGDHKPSGFEPYLQTDSRWFRTTNDSILTQFGYFDGKPRFHHGTAHPTYRTHLHYADAILETGLFH